MTPTPQFRILVKPAKYKKGYIAQWHVFSFWDKDRKEVISQILEAVEKYFAFKNKQLSKN